MMRAALVTTCLNEGDSIRLWMADVAAQTLRPSEVIVVDAGSKDGTYEALREWTIPGCDVRIEQVPGCTVAQGRNRAIALSTAEVIVSTDTGCRLAADWVEEITEPFRTNPDQTDVVAGNYAADCSTVQSAVAWADYYLKNRFRIDVRDGFWPSSRSIAYRRKVWERLGGYPEDLRYAGDDTVFACQIYAQRLRLAFAPRALVYWRRHRTFKKYFKEAYNYGRGNGEAGFRLGPICELPPNPSNLRMIVASARRALDRSLLKPLLTIVGHGRLGAAILLPWLRVGAVYNFNLGYLDGLRYGDAHCSDCRARVAGTAQSRRPGAGR